MAETPRDLRAQQAAEREDQMRDRFGLASGEEGRPGVDAVLPLAGGHQVPFEIKSSDTSDADHERHAGSVSTARDVGREHIQKWRQRHWLFGFYVRGSRNPPVARYYLYASPRQLEPWIAEQETYVVADWDLVRLLPRLADRRLLAAVMHEDKPHYTLRDARLILKQQKLEVGEHMAPELRALLDQAGIGEPRKMGSPVYRALMDRHAGFSRAALTGLVERLAEPPDERAMRNALGDRDFHPLEEVVAFLRGQRLARRPDLAAAALAPAEAQSDRPVGTREPALAFQGGRSLAVAARLTQRAIAAAADHPDGYSPERMVVLVRERARYLLDRGATRNNPHIPERRLLELVPAEQVLPGDAPRRAQRLEELVRRELQVMAAATDTATE